MDAALLEPIPGPPGHPLVGNLFDVDAGRIVESLADLARRYGPIYRIRVPGRGSRVIVSGHALVDELCDDARFDKEVGPGLDALAANPASRGMFTAERRALLALAADDEDGRARYRAQVAGPRRSVLDLLDAFPSCAALPLEVFLGLLPPLRPRYYSISSSPLASPEVCSITVGVVAGPAHGGEGTFRGTCSNYLAAQPVGAALRGFVRRPGIPFRPPGDPRAPVIMVGCGTGIAPFRGFLQERAALKEGGAPVGEALLLFGCRDPLQDFLYEDELRAFEAAGVARVLPAFSREPGRSRTYVQQVIGTEGEAVWRLLRQDAAVYVCGDASGMAPAVRQAFAGVFREHGGATADEAQAWLAELVTRHRYLEDVWASATWRPGM